MTALSIPLQPPAGLAVHHWPCPEEDAAGVPLVLLHGWGGDSALWGGLAELLHRRFRVLAVDLPGFGDSPAAPWDLDTVLELLAGVLPERAVLVGWSLGGMVATAFTQRFPGRVVGLITIAANASFIRRPGWPAAMAPEKFEGFRGKFREDPFSAARQFCGLQARGDDREREVLRRLRAHHQMSPPNANWEAALARLGDLDNRERLAVLTVPSLHLLGENDSLVPASAARDLADLNHRGSVEILTGAGHAPQLAAPDRVAGLIERFAADPEGEKYRIDKIRVARSLGRAAATYDSAAALQRSVGEALLTDIDGAGLALTPEAIADIGCGTGYFRNRLARQFPGATYLGLDLAEGMVAHARHHHPNSTHWLCGDAEHLPLAVESLDLAFSNFTFQWCQALPRLMAEIYRVLRPGGVLAFTTVGPGSLGELRRAWQQVDCFAHVNRFPSADEVKISVAGAGFAVTRFATQRRLKYHADLRGLTRELKSLGAHNLNRGRNGGLTGRGRLRAFSEAYEAQRTPWGLPATWELIRAVAVKPS